MIGVGVAIAVGSFLLIFGSVLALFRFEYGVPTLFSSVISLSVVLMGLIIALAIQAAGIAALHEAAGGLAGMLLAAASAIAVVG